MRKVWIGLMVLVCAVSVQAQKGPVSVADFGATPDGKADSTPAFTKALAAGRDVYVPPGRYRVTDLKLPGETFFHGAGAASVIILAKGEGAVRVADRCRINDLSFTGEEEFKGPNDSESKALIHLGAGKGITLDNIRVTNYKYTAVTSDHGTDLRILNSTFEKVNWAITLVFTKRVLVSGNRVIETGQHGIQFWGNWKFERKECEDLTFTNNYVKDGGGGPIWGTGATRVVYANNIIDGAKDVGLDLEWCDDCTITGNTVRNCLNSGISLFYSCRRVSITGNTVINDRPVEKSEFPATDPRSSYFVRSGIWLTYPNRDTFKNEPGHRDVTIVGNTIYCAEGERRAIWIGSDSDNVLLSANTLRGGNVWYGGQHNVHPMKLTLIKDNMVIRQPFKK